MQVVELVPALQAGALSGRKLEQGVAIEDALDSGADLADEALRDSPGGSLCVAKDRVRLVFSVGVRALVG